MPDALLLGDAPELPLGFSYVHAPPYDAVVIGSASAAALLGCSFPEALGALLAGCPVYIWQPGLEHRRLGVEASPALYARCLAAERELAQWGAIVLRAAPKAPLITAAQASRMKKSGILPHTARMTPLARDILGGDT